MPMQNYYNPYMNAYPTPYGNMTYYQQIPVGSAQQYMINVDGEAAARAWQTPSNPQPNMIIPLFDTDGQHVYFKSFDAYGRMNPIRKGKIVFDDEIRTDNTEQRTPEISYASSEDIKRLEEELDSIRQSIQKQNNQNGGTKARVKSDE